MVTLIVLSTLYLITYKVQNEEGPVNQDVHISVSGKLTS